jgi:hypothetical protein
MKKTYFAILTVFVLAACTSKSSLSMSRNNISVGTATFNGKNVGVDLSDQEDVIKTKMGGGKFIFDNAKNTVKSFFAVSLKDKAKSVQDGKGELTLKPQLTLDIVNDYFTAGCLAKVNLVLLNSKGEQIKAVSKNFKRSYVTSWGYKSACNEASTEVLAVALSAL